jgi:S-adenosylmethionine decarboxylase proenzyme
LLQSGKIIAQALVLGNNNEFDRSFACGRRISRRNGIWENKMDGIHLLGEWYGCAAEMPEMTNAEALRTLCLRAAAASGMTIVGDRFHQFAPTGVTGTVLLAESHLAVHTWPEHGFVTIDVYVCNYTTDNSPKAEHLFRSMQDALRPERAEFQAIHRGGRDA